MTGAATGECLCGTVRYEVDGPFGRMLHCHCSRCRKHHGTGFATFVSAKATRFRWVSGEQAVRRYRSSAHGERPYCGRCGSVVPAVLPALDIALLPAGSLTNDPGVRPEAHIFEGSRAGWDLLHDDLPRHDEYPPEFGTPGLPALPDRALDRAAARSDELYGGCLCGQVAFAIGGTPLRVSHCHCSRCRRGRSAAWATNGVWPMDAFRWERGASLAREYKVPEAQYFTAAFCDTCGSALPRISAERRIVVVPLGSIDSAKVPLPQHHIYYASKAPWSVVRDDLPKHDAGPPA